MSGRPSSSSSPWPSGSPGPSSSSRSLAARLGLFLLKLAILLPVLFYVWPRLQPEYTSAVVRGANALLALEEAGVRVTTLRPAGSTIEVWSTLHQEPGPAGGYNAEVLHFNVVLCVALVLAWPRPAGWRRLLVLAGAAAVIVLFHAAALLVTVEHTYAVRVPDVARRNYTGAEAAVYSWLFDVFAHLAVQALPATILVVLAGAFGGFGRSLAARLAPAEVPATDARRPRHAPEPPEPRRRSLAGRAALAAAGAAGAAVLAAASYGGWVHLGKVRARQAEDLCARGFRAFQAGSNAEAAGLFRAAIERKPTFLEAHDGLGNALSDQPSEAEKAYAGALRLDERYYPSRVGHADALLHLGRGEEAIAEHTRTIELHPDRWEARYNLALALIETGRAAEAEAPLKTTVEMNPSFPDARVELGRLLLGLGRICEALPHLEVFTTLEPDSRDATQARTAIAYGRARCRAPS